MLFYNVTRRPTCVSVICVHMIYSNQLGFSGGETMKYKTNVGGNGRG